MPDTSTLPSSAPVVSPPDRAVPDRAATDQAEQAEQADQDNSAPQRTRWQRCAAVLAGKAPSRAPIPAVAAMTAYGVAVMLLLVCIGVLLHEPLLIPSLAASAALVFGAPGLPLAQPRSVVGGQLISTTIGLAAVAVGGSSLWTAAVAGGLTIGAMAWARTPHSPATASAVIVVLTDPAPLTFLALLTLGTLVIVAAGALLGRVDRVSHSYPAYWW
ncbi:HPP family protein [Streptomyces sp. NPDC004111]|uniref:HPP family protein n=1 Tax=Streptomyces sp. NPDC004111 TaxID=3364690 RepID=UPI003690D27A